MNEFYYGIAFLGVLVIMFSLHRSQRKLIGKSNTMQAAMDERVKKLEDRYLSPEAEARMVSAIKASIEPALNRRLDATDLKVTEIRDFVASIANKVGAT